MGSQWKEASDNVTMTLALPVPQGTEVVPGENVRAWGHGPLDGKVTVNADGTVTYAVPHVAAGQFAEARVAFPVKWLTNLSPESAALHQGENRLDTVLKEEKDWSDQANRTRVLSLAFVHWRGVVCVLLLAGLRAPTSSTDANTSPGLPTSIGATCLTPPSIRRLSDACGAGIARAKTISRLRSCILRTSAPSASTRAVTRNPARSGA